MKNKLLSFSFALGLIAGPGLVQAQCHSSSASAQMASYASADIVQTAVAAGDFTILAQALTAAGLVDTLKGAGPFTVFAPTDEAFKQLPAGTLETLLKPENRAALVAILTYHVVPGKVTAGDVVQLTSARTVEGNSIDINVSDGNVFVDEAQVVKADIAASNGVIHVINKVILP